MADRPKSGSLLGPVDDISGAQLPPRFAEALAEVREAIRRCKSAGISGNTVVAAIMAEAMPRLVETYGYSGASLALAEFAREISSETDASPAIQ